MAALDLPGFSRHRILQRRSERRIVQGIVEKLSLRPPLTGGARFARFLAPPDPAAPQRAAHRAGDRRETVAAPAAHRTRGCVVFRQQSAENPVGAWADALHCGVPFLRATVGVDVGAKIEIYDWWRRGSQSFWFLPTCRRFSTSRIGSMSCIDPAWRPSSPAPTSANRRCCRISSASNKPPVLPRTPWQRTTPRRTRSIDWNGNERQIDQR